MAKRSTRRRKGGYRSTNYVFTSRRKYALKRAQALSAKKRKQQKFVKIARVGGILAGVGAAAYLGHRHRGTIGSAAGNWRNGFRPTNKEATRVSSNIGVAHPSQTTVITPGARAAAQKTRDALAKAQLPPHMGGPDKRIYDPDTSDVNTDAMTKRSVRRTMKHAKKKTQGQKDPGLVGTPGGTRKLKKTSGDTSHGGLTEAQWEAALGFDAPPQTPVVPATKKLSRSQNVPSTTTGSVSGAFTSAQSQAMYQAAYNGSVERAVAGKKLPKTELRSTASWNDLMSHHKNNPPGSLHRKTVSKWNMFSGLDKALKEEKLDRLGYFIDYDTGTIFRQNFGKSQERD
jgi:hypothetical protein